MGRRTQAEAACAAMQVVAPVSYGAVADVHTGTGKLDM